MRHVRTLLFWMPSWLCCLLLASCTYYTTEVKQLPSPSSKTIVKSPAKAHLNDGSLIVFVQGFELKGDSLMGGGVWYDLTRRDSTFVGGVHSDSVAFLEYYVKELEAGPMLGGLAVPVLIMASTTNPEIRKAIFGSCPTIYSDNGSNLFLEAECFSYSIAPRYEAADLDRLDHAAAQNGELAIILKNEALETHYINELKLVTLDHPEGYEAFPTDDHDVALLGDFSSELIALDRSGRDVTDLVHQRDSLIYRSDSQWLEELGDHYTEDWIEVQVPTPPTAKEMWVALRLRNTLFNTVLLYDVMLRSQGAAALDWLGKKSGNLLYAWRLHRWYKQYFGLRIQIWDGDEFKDWMHLNDTGPIAWRQMAVELPVPTGKVARLRLCFLPDNWALDWIAVSFESSADFVRCEYAPDEIRALRGQAPLQALGQLAQSDGDYLLTYPGDAYRLCFETTPPSSNWRRQCFIKSQGFYIEWIRQDWWQAGAVPAEFHLNESTILTTARLWAARKEAFEEQFYSSKISVEGRCSP
ncbi:MAG: hypothetical protein ABH878_00325 [bacterium]